MKIKNIGISLVVKSLWDSPTFNTWLSYSTKALSLFAVLPLILKNFTDGEVALWYLFATIIALQGLADMGFKITFIRLISFAMGGAVDIDVYKDNVQKSNGIPNWFLVGKIYSMMKSIYAWLTLLFLVLLLTIGTWAMVRPIALVEEQRLAWISWSVIVVVSCLKFYGTIYANYLEGLNKIALVRRWEALTSTGSILTSMLVLLTFKSLLALVIANQIWVIVNFVRDLKLSHSVEDGAFKKLEFSHTFDKKFFLKVWGPAWRSGLSGFMSNGLASITSVLYAQFGSASNIASYLLALRLMAQVKEISMAPFYSKIPLFSRLRSQGAIKELIAQSQRGMFLSNLVFVVGAIMIGLFGSRLLSFIGSDVQFIDMKLWILLTIAYFVHRFGAMHIQLYTTTNHIISHIADGVSGVIFILVTLFLIPRVDLYAIPIGMLAGYLGFYSWYAAYNSLKSINTSFLKFEVKGSFLPLLILAFFIVFELIFTQS